MLSIRPGKLGLLSMRPGRPAVGVPDDGALPVAPTDRTEENMETREVPPEAVEVLSAADESVVVVAVAMLSSASDASCAAESIRDT